MVRDGMSCRMIGSAVEIAIALKCAWIPVCIGLLKQETNRKHGIRAGRFGALRQLDRLTGRIGSGAGDDADAALRDPRRRRGRRRPAPLASASTASPAGFADNDRGDAGVDLAFAKFRERRQIDARRFHRTASEGRGCSLPARWRSRSENARVMAISTRQQRAAHIELDLARELDDGFGMMAILEQRVFEGLLRG